MAVHSFSLARFSEGGRWRVQNSLSAHSTKKTMQTSERERRRKSAQNFTNVQRDTQHMKHTNSKAKKNKNPETQVSRIQCLKHFIFNIRLQWLLNESIVYRAMWYGCVYVKMSNLKRQSIHLVVAVVMVVYSIQLQFIFMFHTHFLSFCLCASVRSCFHFFQSENNFKPTIPYVKNGIKWSEVTSIHNSWN